MPNVLYAERSVQASSPQIIATCRELGSADNWLVEYEDQKHILFRFGPQKLGVARGTGYVAVAADIGVVRVAAWMSGLSQRDTPLLREHFNHLLALFPTAGSREEVEPLWPRAADRLLGIAPLALLLTLAVCAFAVSFYSIPVGLVGLALLVLGVEALRRKPLGIRLFTGRTLLQFLPILGAALVSFLAVFVELHHYVR